VYICTNRLFQLSLWIKKPYWQLLLLVDRVGGTEVRVEDFAVANDVPLSQDWEVALGHNLRG
jgi:hypothetical protein